MPAPRSVVITGASTGIGRACALHLDGLGWQVFAGVRKDADGEALKAEASERLTPILLDVTDAESIRAARAAVEDAVQATGLTGLVNNAGVAYGGPIEYLDLAELREAFEVNFFGLVAVTQALLPLLRAGHGRIVNMSSMSGLVASPFLSPYSTSKFAVEALSDALRVELAPWDLHVAVIEPGAIRTAIWTKGADTIQRIIDQAPPEGLKLYGDIAEATKRGLRPHGVPPREVARAVEQALTAARPKTRYLVGADARIAAAFRRSPDRIRDAFFLRQLKRRR